MRIFQNSYELISEMSRDLWEMGMVVKPKSFQNQLVDGLDDYITKEINNYHYRLIALPDPDNLLILSPKGSKEWVNKEFAERVGEHFVNPGEAWKIRYSEWEPLLNEDNKMDYTYHERLNFNGNLNKIILELTNNPDSRQTWLPIFNPKDVAWMGGKRRIPCSLGYNFFVRDNQLNLTYIQRSADMISHIGNDISLAWAMKEYVAFRVGVEVGYLDHFIFSLHSYKKDWVTLETGISKL